MFPLPRTQGRWCDGLLPLLTTFAICTHMHTSASSLRRAPSRCDRRFVEDRYETLEGVSLSMLGAPVSLYLATWGYNTERTRKRAERNPLVQTLSLSDFCTKMQ